MLLVNNGLFRALSEMCGSGPSKKFGHELSSNIVAKMPDNGQRCGPKLKC
jgi:hypothetical protein